MGKARISGTKAEDSSTIVPITQDLPRDRPRMVTVNANMGECLATQAQPAGNLTNLPNSEQSIYARVSEARQPGCENEFVENSAALPSSAAHPENAPRHVSAARSTVFG